MAGYEWLAKLVTVAILAGFSSVILVMLLGQSRVFYSMAKDGLLPKMFSEIHPKYKTPYKANLIILVLVGLFAAFIPGDVVGDMTSIGTLFAFCLVCIGVIILRKTDPDLPRQFRAPWVPVLPILGVVVCLLMMLGLGWTNWTRLIGWLVFGRYHHAFGFVWQCVPASCREWTGSPDVRVNGGEDAIHCFARCRLFCL